MNFFSFKHFLRGNEADIHIGVCSYGDRVVKCVEKIYNDNCSYSKVKNAQNTFPEEIMQLGPHIHFTDDNKREVYMEYIECDTLEEYLDQFNILNERHHGKLIKLFKAIHIFMTQMKNFGTCHGDLHTGNLMVCHTDTPGGLTIRMLDIDSLLRFEDMEFECDDNYLLGETILRAFLKEISQARERERGKGCCSITVLLTLTVRSRCLLGGENWGTRGSSSSRSGSGGGGRSNSLLSPLPARCNHRVVGGSGRSSSSFLHIVNRVHFCGKECQM